ncbi:MAG: HU family DNA-binding protein, partial [Alkalispirochaetaceae bacterium]
MSASKLTKAQIVESISAEVDVSKKDIHYIIDQFFEEVKSALLEDKVVEFRGFGTFEVRTRKGRERARNPKTGETVQVRNHGVVVFRPGKEL